jgi:hypothetical protein
MPVPLTNQLEDLVTTVAALALARTGKMVMLTVTAPPALAREELATKSGISSGRCAC